VGSSRKSPKVGARASPIKKDLMTLKIEIQNIPTQPEQKEHFHAHE
jgi:hypothetical protein